MADTVVSNPQEVPMEEGPGVSAYVSFLEEQARQQQAASEARFRAQQDSSYDIIQRVLADYGLENMRDFVHDIVFTQNIVDENIIIGRLRETPQYKERFAGNEARRAAGMNVLSESEYIRLENTFAQTMRQSGLPKGFYDEKSDFVSLIANDVSPAELASRVQDGYQAVRDADPEVVLEMQRLYGVDEGSLAAYFLDPEKATPVLLQQARAAQIGGQGVRQAGYQISATQAEELARAGVSPEQARAGFQAIAGAEELFTALPGQTGEDITQEEAVAGVFATSAAAQQRIRRRTRERQAEFEAGGGFAAQGSQVTGLT
jgi:hypothetical protein